MGERGEDNQKVHAPTYKTNKSWKTWSAWWLELIYCVVYLQVVIGGDLKSSRHRKQKLSLCEVMDG